jgi:hypothetical protein
MATRSSQKPKKMGRLARRVARIERRTLKIAMLPMIVIAQRRMAKTFENAI